jgi:hypothetical protein
MFSESKPGIPGSGFWNVGLEVEFSFSPSTSIRTILSLPIFTPATGESYDLAQLDSICGAGGNAFVWFIRICSIPVARSINPDGSIHVTQLSD